MPTTWNATPAHPSAAAPDLPEIRRIRTHDLNWALAEGWRDFTEKRGDLIFLGLLYPIVCFLAVLLASNAPLRPLLFPLVAGLSIAGPAVASGFYELARRRAAWHPARPYAAISPPSRASAARWLSVSP